MKQCNICGAEITETDNFCENCGNPIGETQNVTMHKKKNCDVCGEEIDGDANFCKNCGNPIVENQIKQWPDNDLQNSKPREHKQINVVGLFALIGSVFELFLMYSHPFIAFFFIGMPTSLLCYYGRKRKPKSIAVVATVIGLINSVIFLIIILDFWGIIKL